MLRKAKVIHSCFVRNQTPKRCPLDSSHPLESHLHTLFHAPCWSFLLNEILALYLSIYLLKILFTYFEREGKGGRKRGRETETCGCLSHTPHQEPGLQPRHVPWLAIKPATLWFPGQRSIHWATPARAGIGALNKHHSWPISSEKESIWMHSSYNKTWIP